jgi:hypothetical protein
MSKFKKTDIVYDLGCGDGWPVISAAKEYGACGVGSISTPSAFRKRRRTPKKLA